MENPITRIQILSLARDIYMAHVPPDATEQWKKAQAKNAIRSAEIFYEEFYS